MTFSHPGYKDFIETVKYNKIPHTVLGLLNGKELIWKDQEEDRNLLKEVEEISFIYRFI